MHEWTIPLNVGCVYILKVAWMYKNFHFTIHQYYTRPILACYWILEKDAPKNNTIYTFKVVRNQHSDYCILVVIIVAVIIIITIDAPATLGNLYFICNPTELPSWFHHYKHEIEKHDFFPGPRSSNFFLSSLGNNSWLFCSSLLSLIMHRAYLLRLVSVQ